MGLEWKEVCTLALKATLSKEKRHLNVIFPYATVTNWDIM
jgi:hypothetical protein